MSAMKPKNLTAFAAANVTGNPPSTHPSSSVENCYPGLEFDIRNLFRKVFVGLTVDALFPLVLSVEDAALRELLEPGAQITQIDDQPVRFRDGWDITLVSLYRLDPDDPSRGARVRLQFNNAAPFDTRFRRLVVDGFPVGALAGQLTQSLCSPWQHDFLECGCYYWAASRPDLVTSEEHVTGQSWLRPFDHTDEKDSYQNYRTTATNSPYPEIEYKEIYHAWEQLGFVRKRAVQLDPNDPNALEMRPVEEDRKKDP